MPNLQYIGARYVPKFYENPDTGDMTWKSGVGYEPLTVVKYNDDTYTSKKPVPSNIGNPASNPIYWAKTADFNAALQALQNNVNELQTIVNNIGKFNKVITIGDSYDNTGDWSLRLQEYLNISNDNWYRNYLGGTGFHVDNSAYPGSTNGFLRMLTDVVTAMSADDKENVSDVIIMGGFNDNLHYPDSSGVTAIATGISDVSSYVKSNLPNAKLHVGFIGVLVDGVYSGSVTFDDLIFTQYCYMSGCFSNNVHYMNSVKYALFDANYASELVGANGFINTDGMHPNARGGRHIAKYAALNLNNCDTALTEPVVESTVTRTFADGSTDTITVAISQTANQCKLTQTATGNIHFGTGLTTQDNREVQVGTWTIPRSLYYNKPHDVYGTSLAIYTNNGRHIVPLRLHFYHDTCTMFVFTEFADTITQLNAIKWELVTDIYDK